MRADNDGEGGIMALTALAQRTLPGAAKGAYVVGILGVFGAALFFGDGVLTPAISVLSAVEGLQVAAPALQRWVLPATIAVLVVLFATQRFGTDRVGKAFGPVIILWFIALAVIGAHNIAGNADVLQGVEPMVGHPLLRRTRLARSLHPRRSGARGHGRRGAVRRHGPFRPAPDPVRPGCSSCCLR